MASRGCRQWRPLLVWMLQLGGQGWLQEATVMSPGSSHALRWKVDTDSESQIHSRCGDLIFVFLHTNTEWGYDACPSRCPLGPGLCSQFS